jgi:hypothetical protein
MKTPKAAHLPMSKRRKSLKRGTRADEHLLGNTDIFDLNTPSDIIPDEERGEMTGRLVNDEKYEALLVRVRYMHSWKQKGYKFTGEIPAPKDVGYYLPNDTI